MNLIILAFIGGIAFAILCSELAKALGRKMAKLEELIP
jgi:ABC-type polysaccharide transport system permease subunit